MKCSRMRYTTIDQSVHLSKSEDMHWAAKSNMTWNKHLLTIINYVC